MADRNRRLRVDSSAPRMVEPESEIRRLFRDTDSSNLTKYMWLTVGRKSWLALIHYEMLNLLFAGMRGAIGIYCRQLFYRRMFRRCGRGVVIGRNVTIRHAHRIELGDRVIIDDNAVLDGKGSADCTIKVDAGAILGRNSILVCKGGTIHLAEDVNISVNCTLISESRLEIGAKSLIGGHCYVIAGGNHGTELSGVPLVDQPRIDRGGITICSNCWIGANSTVLDGVSIGPDAIVAAAALVNRTVAAKTIVGGVPATLIKDAWTETDYSENVMN